MNTSTVELPERGSILPGFELPEGNGGTVRLRQYKPKYNPVLFFLNDHRSDAACMLLEGISRNYTAYRQQEAQVLVIIGAPRNEAHRLQREQALPFPVLADETGNVRAKYVPDGYAGLFIADRYAELYFKALKRSEADLPEHTEIIERVMYIELQCSS